MLDAFFGLVDVVLPFLREFLIYWNWCALSIAVYIGTTSSIDWGFGDRVGIFFAGLVCVLADQLTAPVFGQDRIELLTLSARIAVYTAAGYGLMLSPILSYAIRSVRQKRNAGESL
jgi:hypothetical protein